MVFIPSVPCRVELLQQVILPGNHCIFTGFKYLAIQDSNEFNIQGLPLQLGWMNIQYFRSLFVRISTDAILVECNDRVGNVFNNGFEFEVNILSIHFHNHRLDWNPDWAMKLYYFIYTERVLRLELPLRSSAKRYQIDPG